MKDKIENFLTMHPVPERKLITSFHLVRKQYEIFKQICKKRGVKPSTIINLFIEEFVEKYRGKEE